MARPCAVTRPHRSRLPEFGFGIECDSTEWHTLPYQIERDLNRQNRILGSGFHLLRYSSAALRREPDRVIAEILETLVSRGCTREPTPVWDGK